MTMKTMRDIYDLLKNYGTYIYTGDRLGDLLLMEEEIRTLFKARAIDTRDFQAAINLIHQEQLRLESNKK